MFGTPETIAGAENLKENLGQQEHDAQRFATSTNSLSTLKNNQWSDVTFVTVAVAFFLTYKHFHYPDSPSGIPWLIPLADLERQVFGTLFDQGTLMSPSVQTSGGARTFKRRVKN